MAGKKNYLGALNRACEQFSDVYDRARDGALPEGRADFMLGKRIEKLAEALTAVIEAAQPENEEAAV